MARPLFHILNEVSEADLRAIPPARAGAQFRKFATDRGASPGLTLLTRQKSNAKTNRNATSSNPIARASLQATVTLSPASTSGIVDVCGHCSTPGCRDACLSDSGRFSGDASQRAQRIKTEYAALHPDWFLALMRDEQRQHAEEAWAQQLHPFIRRNTLSDVPYHRLQTAPIIIGEYEEHPSGIHIPKELQHLPGMTTSEYSKEDMRDVVDKEEDIPFRSVHITPSVSELTTAPRIQQVLESGRNVAIPVAKSKKEEPHPFLVVEDSRGRTVTGETFNMDRDDARFADQEQGKMGVLTEKEQGNFGSGAYALNPHTGRYGFIRPHTPGQPEDVPVRLRNMHFRDGIG